MKNRSLCGRGFCVCILGVFLAYSLTGCRQIEESLETGMEANAAGDDTEHAKVSTVTLTEGKYSEEKLDDSWEEEESVSIKLNGDKISADTDGTGIKVLESQVMITQGGTYVLSGALDDGQIIIDADKDELVRLVLNGAELNCSSSAPIYSKGGNVVIILAEGTENSVTDGTEYIYEEGEDEPGAAIFAKDDLTFNGTGTLNVTGNYNHGIQCKDDLKFITGTYVVKASDDGIVGKDSVTVKNGNFTVECKDDGIKATNTEESDKGYVLIEGGSFRITAGGDGIQAETLLRVNDGNIEIESGGGSRNANQKEEMPVEGSRPGGRMMPSDGQEKDGGRRGDKMTPPDGREPEDDMTLPKGQEEGSDKPGGGMMPPNGQEEDGGLSPAETGNGTVSNVSGESAAATDSTKALKSYVDLIIADGDFVLDSCDDGIHSNQNVTIRNGSFVICSGDDGIHADQTLTVEDGDIDIQQSYEGFEGFEVVIGGGDVKIQASDDGINAAGDDEVQDRTADLPADSKGEENTTAKKEWERGNPMAAEDQGASLTVNGGTVYVNADGDGLDANGDIFINGGDIVVHGPADGGNGTLDYASVCKITGGTFVGIGSAGMVQNPGEDSTQPVIVWKLNAPVEAGTVITVKDKEGKVIAEQSTLKTAQWFAVSSPELIKGETYIISAGDTAEEVNLKQMVTMAE